MRLAPAPVGLALSGDERHVFVTSELDARWRSTGVVSVVDARRALDGAAGAVRGSAPAGCRPVRVIHDAARDVVWVSARESHAVLAFDGAALVDRPGDALLATVPVRTIQAIPGSALTGAVADRDARASGSSGPAGRGVRRCRIPRAGQVTRANVNCGK